MIFLVVLTESGQYLGLIRERISSSQGTDCVNDTKSGLRIFAFEKAENRGYGGEAL